MTSLLQSWARALGGTVYGNSVQAPGPGHSAKDRSLIITISAAAPNGFLVHSFAGDDPIQCLDYVRGRLGLEPFTPSAPPPLPKLSAQARTTCLQHRPELETLGGDETRRIEAARRIWAEAGPVAGTLGEQYLREKRSLWLDEDLLHVVRFHSRSPWCEGNEMLRVPALVAAMRAIDGDEITGVQRTRLAQDGTKIERRMLGKASGAAIKIDRDEDVTYGLAISEGLESALSARLLGFIPAWAVGSSGAVGAFPALSGIDCLAILAETDDSGTNVQAVRACTDRWLAAGREVVIIEPRLKGDANDVLKRGMGA